MIALVSMFPGAVAGCIGAGMLGAGRYRIDLSDGTSREATDAEVLQATQAQKIAVINAECRARLVARFGPAEEQVSRSLGIYGAAEKTALETGIAATIDASNTASDAVLAVAAGPDALAHVEAVTVTWPVI